MSSKADLTDMYYTYWLILLALMIWIPTMVMFTAFIVISFRLRHANRSFTYLSPQSRIARSRRKVIRMLFFLIVIELICWSPWAFFNVGEVILDKQYGGGHPEVNVAEICVYST